MVAHVNSLVKIKVRDIIKNITLLRLREINNLKIIMDIIFFIQFLHVH